MALPKGGWNVECPFPLLPLAPFPAPMKTSSVYFALGATALATLCTNLLHSATAANAPTPPPGVTIIPGTEQWLAPVRDPKLPKGTMTYNIRDYGAVGDGLTVDSDAVNRAIDAAAANGGGTVYFPAGYYLCYSIHLKTNITLYLDQGSWIIAAETPAAITALQPRGGRGGAGAAGARGAGGQRAGTPPAQTRGGAAVDTTAISGNNTPVPVTGPVLEGAPPGSIATVAQAPAPTPVETTPATPGQTPPPAGPGADFPPPAPEGAREAFLAKVPAGAKMYDLIEVNQ